MDIISQKQAKELGLKTYFTNKACKHGHITERYVTDGHCVICKTNRKIKSRNEGYNKKYYELNKDKKKKYRIDNKNACIERNRKYYLANKERLNELMREHYTNNKDYYIMLRHGRRSNIKNLVITITDYEKLVLFDIYKQSRKLGPGYHVDHIYPVSKGGRHSPNNLMITPAEFNLSKGDKLLGNPALWKPCACS